MEPRPIRLVLGVALPLALVAAAGCGRGTAPEVKTKAALVQAAYPDTQPVADTETFTGRTEAVKSVDVRARVTGYIDKVNLKDGAEVKKNEVLFEIDPRPYEATLERVKGEVTLAQARRDRANADLARVRSLASKGVTSKEELDKAIADQGEAAAAVKSAEANVVGAQLDLDFTKVTAPIAGLASLAKLTEGNLVRANVDVLTNIVSVDPIYVAFDMDERTLLRILRLIEQGKITPRDPKNPKDIPVQMALANDEGFPFKGGLNFIDNQVDPSTGTLHLRAKFDNPERKDGARPLSPGLFARVQVPIGKPADALVIPDRAIGTDQGQKFVYVVKDGKVEYRKITTGIAQPGGLRVVSEGLKKDDQIIVNGLQRVRPGSEVQVQEVDMRTLQPISSKAE